MIYIEMYGRMGNQMFRYAFARAIQLKYFSNEELLINFNNVNGEKKNDEFFRDELKNLNTVDYQVYEKRGKVIANETTITQKLCFLLSKLYVGKYDPFHMNYMEKRFQKISGFLNKVGIYWSWVGYQKPIQTEKNKKFISGNFEAPEYFESIRPQLLKEFTPKKPLLKHNEELMNLIENSESVCISVRRGDFVTNKELSELHSVTTKDYFEKAIFEISKHVNNPKFIIFSDDVEWAKANINFGESEFFSERGNDPVWEKLRLMYSCKHFIISNSTFSWWAQWLSTNDKKIVISPSRWFNNDYSSLLIQDDFLKIKV